VAQLHALAHANATAAAMPPAALPAGVARVRLADLRGAEGHASDEWLAAVRHHHTHTQRISTREHMPHTQPQSAALTGGLTRAGMCQVAAVASSMTATGALVLSLDDAARVDGVEALLASADAFFAAPSSVKARHAADGDARGAVGYRALPGKEIVDVRLGCDAARVPEALARGAPLALATLTSAARAVLSALGRRLVPSVDLCALCEPAPLEPGVLGASVLSVFRYAPAPADAAGPSSGLSRAAHGAAPHTDVGLLTLIASPDAGLELLDRASVVAGGGAWVALQLRRGEVAVLAGATLAAASGDAVAACMHRVAAQAAPRLSLALRLRGAPGALMPPVTVAAFEARFVATHASVNRAALAHAAAPAADARAAPAPVAGERERRGVKRESEVQEVDAPPRRYARKNAPPEASPPLAAAADMASAMPEPAGGAGFAGNLIRITIKPLHLVRPVHFAFRAPPFALQLTPHISLRLVDRMIPMTEPSYNSKCDRARGSRR
jgi:hypothetical protein